MRKKDYIMDIMFDSLVNFIQSELQTQTIPPDDKKTVGSEEAQD